jgi:hypothetical protein
VFKKSPKRNREWLGLKGCRCVILGGNGKLGNPGILHCGSRCSDFGQNPCSRNGIWETRSRMKEQKPWSKSTKKLLFLFVMKVVFSSLSHVGFLYFKEMKNGISKKIVLKERNKCFKKKRIPRTPSSRKPYPRTRKVWDILALWSKYQTKGFSVCYKDNVLCGVFPKTTIKIVLFFLGHNTRSGLNEEMNIRKQKDYVQESMKKREKGMVQISNRKSLWWCNNKWGFLPRKTQREKIEILCVHGWVCLQKAHVPRKHPPTATVSGKGQFL